MSRQERFEAQAMKMLQVLWQRQEALADGLDAVDVSLAAVMEVLAAHAVAPTEEFKAAREKIAAAKKVVEAQREAVRQAARAVPVPDIKAAREADDYEGAVVFGGKG